MKAGSSRVQDPELKRLRALMMLEFKLKNNATNAAVAREFNVSEDTVIRALNFAKRAELVVSLEDKILSELMPAAHKAILAALTDPDSNKVEQGKLAVKIFEGGLPGFGKKPTGKDSGQSAGSELERYIEQFRSGHGIADGEVVSGGFVEGEPQRALPPAAESADEKSADGVDSQEQFRPSAPETSAEAVGFGIDEGTASDSE